MIPLKNDDLVSCYKPDGIANPQIKHFLFVNVNHFDLVEITGDFEKMNGPIPPLDSLEDEMEVDQEGIPNRNGVKRPRQFSGLFFPKRDSKISDFDNCKPHIRPD